MLLYQQYIFMTIIKSEFFKNQVLPLTLTVIIFGLLVFILWLEILILNYFTPTDILLNVSWFDIAIGLTIYLKTSIDFAIYIGHLMHNNPGWRGRIAIEIGTATGNALGTMIVLAIWTFFKEVRWLLALMIAIASLVLLKMAEDSLDHTHDKTSNYPVWFQKFIAWFEKILSTINKLSSPLLKYILPNLNPTTAGKTTFWPLFGLSFTVPFILGLDDFAGYVPLFTIVNVFGFSIGVFLGHMILNILLYISPVRTIKAVQNPVLAVLGSLVFLLLAGWGFVEVVSLMQH